MVLEPLQTPELDNWLSSQSTAMADDVYRLAEINSGTRNLSGVDRVAESASRSLIAMGASVERVALPSVESIDDHGRACEFRPADAVVARARPDATTRVLLSIHLDTVFDESHPFQRLSRPSADRLQGPGVLDAKGGLVVMLYALRAFERLPVARRIGWTALLNTDEEIGSPASSALLVAEAGRHEIGLVFEPALPDGAWVGARRGSGNFTLVMRGRSAHAGRDFDRGRNALLALIRALDKIARLTDTARGVTVNVARVAGGGPSNVIPDLAVGRFNVRLTEPSDVPPIRASLDRLAMETASELGCTAELSGDFAAPPKPMTEPLLKMHERVAQAAKRSGVSYRHRATGGVCDGNRIAAAGCPCVDTMGPVGDGMHSSSEWVELPSLEARARITLGVLVDFASEAES